MTDAAVSTTWFFSVSFIYLLKSGSFLEIFIYLFSPYVLPNDSFIHPDQSVFFSLSLPSASHCLHLQYVLNRWSDICFSDLSFCQSSVLCWILPLSLWLIDLDSFKSFLPSVFGFLCSSHFSFTLWCLRIYWSLLFTLLPNVSSSFSSEKLLSHHWPLAILNLFLWNKTISFPFCLCRWSFWSDGIRFLLFPFWLPSFDLEILLWSSVNERGFIHQDFSSPDKGNLLKSALLLW